MDDLTGWSFANIKCQINFRDANLTNADLHNADLTGNSFSNVTVTNADFSGAIVTNVDFEGVRGFTANQFYSTATYQNSDLSVSLDELDLTGWSFLNKQLHIDFMDSTVISANFSGATIDSCTFLRIKGLTASQIYSTASYQNRSLAGIALESEDMTGWSFASQDLTGAFLNNSILTGADFTGANISGVSFLQVTGFTPTQLYSTATYQSHILTGIAFNDDDLTGWDFSNQNLAGVDFSGATLTAANFTNATINGVQFFSFSQELGVIGMTANQLYSTASYKNHDLSGIQWGSASLAGWNFSGQNMSKDSFYNSDLTGANLSSVNLTSAGFLDVNLTGANLSHANLSNASLNGTFTDADMDNANLSNATGNGSFTGTNLSNANFTGATISGIWSDADLRGAIGWKSNGTLHNTIQPDGTIAGLSMQIDEVLVIRNNPIPITITQSATFISWSTLQYLDFILDRNWTSSVSFAPGIVPSLAGTLILGLADDANSESLVGTTFQVFNWNGPLPNEDQFLQIISGTPGLMWDTSKLYTNGTVTLVGIPEPIGMPAATLMAIGLCRRRKKLTPIL